MATYSATTEVNQTLVANTVDTVTITSTPDGDIRIINQTGTNPIYVTLGTISTSFAQGQHGVEVPVTTTVQPPVPTIGGANEIEVPAVAGASIELDVGVNGAIVSLISAGAMAYSVMDSSTIDEINP